MSANTKYGYCRGCEQWVRRDDMLSINVSIYSEENEETRVPLRFCKACHDNKREEIESMRWDNVLHTEAEIQADMELASQSGLDFDPTIIVKKSEIPVDVIPEFRPPVKRGIFDDDDDSEAAMRRRGRMVDLSY